MVRPKKNGELKITAEYKIKIDDTNTKESQKNRRDSIQIEYYASKSI